MARFSSSSGGSGVPGPAGPQGPQGIPGENADVANFQFNENRLSTDEDMTISVNGVPGIVNIGGYMGVGVQFATSQEGAGLRFPDDTVQTTAYTGLGFTGSWTIPAGTSTRSFTVDWNKNYIMWVRGNIPNGIIVWNARVSVTNANVPIIGDQYGWYYADGNALVLNSIPNQIIGTNGSIINTSPAVADSNTFSFGITNNSGSECTIQYGYIKI
jgi:hypothetical protein